VWSVDDAPAAFIARQLRAIVGVELTIDRVEAKRKLSQNRPEEDHAGVVSGLRSSGASNRCRRRRNGAVTGSTTGFGGAQGEFDALTR